MKVSMLRAYCIALALLVACSAAPHTSPAAYAAGKSHAGPLGGALVRNAGKTAVLIVANSATVQVSLLTAGNRLALGRQLHNASGAKGQHHALSPVPVLLLGSHTTPTVKAALAQIKSNHPVRLYLLGMSHQQRLTLVTNTLFDGLTVYINKTPGNAHTFTQFTRAVAAARQFVPVIVRHGRGVTLANAQQVDASEPVTAPDISLPSAAQIDISLLPPVGDQGQESSCVGWSSSYYYKTFLEAKNHHWNPSDPNVEFSPSFIYNQINGGQDNGSLISDAMEVMVQQGDIPISVFPYHEGDYLSQPTQTLIAAAAQFHSSDFGYLYAGHQQTAPDLNNLKRWLAGGDGFVMALQVPDPSFSEYQGVYDGPYARDTGYGGHALFVIGYDDNGGGTGIGAFRVINSWGTNWGDSGYGWISYRYIAAHMMEAWVMKDAQNGPLNPAATPTSVIPTVAPQPTATPQATQSPLGPSSVIYSGSGSYKLQPNPATRTFTANLTFTFAARTSDGRTVEAHQTYFKEAVDPNSDTVFSLHFTMDDGTVLTGQVEVISGPLPA